MNDERSPTWHPSPGDDVPAGGPTLTAWRAVAIAVVFMITQLVVGIALGIALGVYLFLTLHGAEPEALVEAGRPLTLAIGVVGMLVAGAVALWLTRRALRGPAGLALAPLGWRPSTSRDVAMALAAGAALALAYFVLIHVHPPAEGQLWGTFAMAAAAGGWPRHLWALIAIVIAPPVEEFVFRGVLLEGLSNGLGVRAAAVIVTVVFVLAHGLEALTYWPAWVGIGLVATATVVVRLRSGSLLPSIALHAGYNTCLVVAVYVGLA